MNNTNDMNHMNSKTCMDCTDEIWSSQIQGIDTLYLSRKLRFADEYRESFTKLFQIPNKENERLRILEIGCGPGALAASLHRWYPKAEIIGMDRDSRFIEFAQKEAAGVSFVMGDATKLPFKDASFDVTISNTVCEHIEPSSFYREQLRVLKPGGVCLVLSSRKGISIPAACLEETEEETAFWKRVQEQEDDTIEKYSIGRYAMTETELPKAMEQYGFGNVSTGYVIEEFTPDSASCTREKALEIIEADRRGELDSVASTEYRYGNVFEAEAFMNVRERIHQRYDERVRLYLEGIHQWDTQTSLIMVVRGEKA